MQKISNIMFQLNSEERKAMKVVIGVLTLIMAVFVLPVTTQATDVSHFILKGPTAAADFFSIDSTGCIFTGVTLSASNLISHSPPGPPSSQAGAFVGISQFNSCTQTQLFSGTGSASFTDSEFQIGTKLESATLNTTISVCDSVSNSFVNISVNLSWACAVKPFYENAHMFSHFSDFILNVHTFGTTCDSASASGSVSNGTTNFTPEPSETANIVSVNIGELGVIK